MYELRERCQRRLLQYLLSTSNVWLPVYDHHSIEAQKPSPKSPIKRKKILDKQKENVVNHETRPRRSMRLQQRKMKGEGATGLPRSILRAQSKTFPVTGDSRPRVKRITWKMSQVQGMG
jgi:hypothetical protein